MNKIIPSEKLLGSSGDKDRDCRQRLAVDMAWQILETYPTRPGIEWKPYRPLRGVMLSDEVGFGKTFEALAIVARYYLSRTRTRRDRFRVLILAAPAIQSKWSPEKDTQKFIDQLGIQNRKKDLERLLCHNHRPIRRAADWMEATFWPRQAAFLCSLGAIPRLKSWRYRHPFPTDCFDVIVVDEAHVARSGMEDESSMQNPAAIRKIRKILERCPTAKVLLLTATPFQNHAGEFKRLLGLLASSNGDSRVSRLASDSVIDRIKRSLKTATDKYEYIREMSARNDPDGFLQSAYSLYRLLDIDHDNNQDTKRPKALWRPRHREMDGLDDYLRDVVVRNVKPRLKIEREFIPLDEPSKFKYLLLRDLIGSPKAGVDEDDLRDFVSVRLSQLVSTRKTLKSTRAREILSLPKSDHFCLKMDGLVKRLGKLKNELATDKRKKQIVTVFFRFIPSLEQAEKMLQEIFRRSCVKTLTGKTKIKARSDILCELNKVKSFGVLLASQVGNEGLDFDGFSRCVIHFDGHYNPAVIDQRNGRVYRGKNNHRAVRVHDLVLGETYDQRIRHIELEKRKIKDFFLGDAEMSILLKKVDTAILLRRHRQLRRRIRLDFKIDLEPKRRRILTLE